jgi:chorismate dehydratase
MQLEQPASRQPVRIGRISYMNVAPIYYGLDRQEQTPWCEIVAAPPATLNRKMAAGELDISPVSTAAYADYQHDWLILPNLSISCDGPVMSVVLASRFSVRDLDGKSVVISDESASAAALLRLIFKEQGVRPHISCRKLDDTEGFATADAVLVIGDAALNGRWQKNYRHVWDLCGSWKEATGLPFVFALWAVRRAYAREHAPQVCQTLAILNESRRRGCANLPAITAALRARCGLEYTVLERYFKGLAYDLDAAKLKGLKEFYARLHRYNLIAEPVEPDFWDAAGPGRPNEVYDGPSQLPTEQLAAGSSDRTRRLF